MAVNVRAIEFVFVMNDLQLVFAKKVQNKDAVERCTCCSEFPLTFSRQQSSLSCRLREMYGVLH